MDFTINSYKKLIKAFITANYNIITVEEGVSLPKEYSDKVVILRHDVDELATNALEIAKAEHELGINSTFFFRTVKQSNNPEVIQQISAMGHEIGYHYEDLSKSNGDMQKATVSFEQNLSYFRKFYPVKSVCMHGSSSSEFDNRDIWKNHNLHDYGLIAEPYLSFDFNKFFYLTDTGYAWDGGKFAIRDIVESPFNLKFHSTAQIIDAIEENRFPDQAMILAHTLWSGNLLQWIFLHIREFLRNNIKLAAKKNKLVSIFYKKLVSSYWKQNNYEK